MEVFRWIAEGLIFSLTILVPFIAIFRPSPTSYFKFVHSVFHVRMDNDPAKPRALLLFLFVQTVNMLVTQAVHVYLHYPLLVTQLGASILQIGVVDALCSGANVIVPFTRVIRMGRTSTFHLQAFCSLIGYVMVIGVLLRLFGSGMLPLGLFFVGQVVSGLPFGFMELANMRLDVKDDIINDPGVDAEYRNAEHAVQDKLVQLQFLRQYPTSLIGGVICTPFLQTDAKNIFNLYILMGLLSTLSWLFVGYLSRGHVARPTQKKIVGEETTVFHDIRPGGMYFQALLQVGAYTAILSTVGHGYTRMLNLRVLSLGGISERSLGNLLILVFSISTAFFWLSDSGSVSTACEDEKKRMNARRSYSGFFGFVLMTIGHITLGVGGSYDMFLLSALSIGFGQAATTGLGACWKDEVRDVLHQHGRSGAYRKKMDVVLSAAATIAGITNSLIVGVLGHYFGLGTTSMFYALLGALGCLISLGMRRGLNIRDPDGDSSLQRPLTSECS